MRLLHGAAQRPSDRPSQNGAIFPAIKDAKDVVTVDPKYGAARGFFDNLLRADNPCRPASSIEGLPLPDDLEIIHWIAIICQREAGYAFRDGRHLEGRRLDSLGRQFNNRIFQRRRG